MPGKDPRCQVGTINIPDDSGQQLRIATIVPRSSRPTTWST